MNGEFDWRRQGPGPMGPPPWPPRPPMSRGTKVGIGIGLVSVVALAGLWLFGMWVYMNHDRPEFIDDMVVAETVDAACARMTMAVEQAAAPPGASTDATVRAIRDQDAAVTDMVQRIRGLGAERLKQDYPAPAWLADWEKLVKLREQYARELAGGGRPRFAVPTVDGDPITKRMNEVGLRCKVPLQLTALE